MSGGSSNPPRTGRAARSRMRPLPRSFYARPAELVARELLGCVLIHARGGAPLGGRIVETEAYVGERDRASHASRGRTPRNSVMYEAPGHAYVYFIYGMYDMLNVVCQPAGVPEAVLIRGLEPLLGVETMQRRRGVRRTQDIANGPGKLCRALAITRAHNRANLVGATLWVTSRPLRSGEEIAVSGRIGVGYAGADAHLPLRFFIAGNACVSRRAVSSPATRTRARRQ